MFLAGRELRAAGLAPSGQMPSPARALSMSNPISVVVTSISAPNQSLHALAKGAEAHGLNFIVMGDTKSPSDFHLAGCDFYDVARQERTGFGYAKLCPTKSYTRKNIGYLIAIAAGAPLVLETDDDNIPREAFWKDRELTIDAPRLAGGGWVNVYGYFSEVNIWPRGLPLDAVQAAVPSFEALRVAATECPIQQGLADGDPDVDAIYRLLLPLPQNFRVDRRVISAQVPGVPSTARTPPGGHKPIR